MKPDEPTAGDYGYDMAHEGAEKEPGGRHRAPDPDPAHPERTAAIPEPEGDYGYDEAHGF